MNDPAPDWSLLPDHPEKFFGVSKNDDEREARRAYTRLIRVYKPDSHPDEFMKIRAAYEKLTLLRNIHQFETASGEEDAPPADDDAPEEETGDGEAKQESPLALLSERLRREDPVSAYAWMRSQPLTSPVHYYCLGLLSDVVKEDGQSTFETWILEGARVFPDDGVLASLLGQLCARSRRPDDIGEMAVRALQARELHAQFPVIRASLLHCSPAMRLRLFKRLLSDARNASDSKDVFWYSRLIVETLRSAASLDDPAVLREAIEFLDENHTYIPDEANPLLDLVELYKLYADSRPGFLNGNPHRALLDGLIQKFMREESLPHNDLQRACRQSLSDADEFLRAFPRHDEACKPAMAMAAALMQCAIDEDESLIQYPGREGGLMVFGFMKKKLHAPIVHVVDSLMVWGAALLTIFIIFTLICMFEGPGSIDYNPAELITLAVLAGFAVVYGRWVRSWFKVSKKKRFLSYYEGSWRASAIRFLRAGGLYWNEFAYGMETSAAKDSGESKYFQEEYYGDLPLRMLYFGLEYEPRALPGRRDDVS